MIAIAEAMRAATGRLAAVSDTARLDAELLMAQALGRTREALLLGDATAPAPADFDDLVARRLAHEPIAYILGHKHFWTIELAVSPAVLIPRPDSETLIEAAIAHFGTRSPRRILDLGTGSGALLLAALSEWPEAEGIGIDASPAALAVAAANAEALGIAARFELGDWRGDPAADLILCNPPYVADGEILPPSVAFYEPAAALFAGADGLDDYRRIAAVLDFAAGGAACIEIGHRQAAAVTALFAAEGFACTVATDIAGRDRCLIATRA